MNFGAVTDGVVGAVFVDVGADEAPVHAFLEVGRGSVGSSSGEEGGEQEGKESEGVEMHCCFRG